MILGMEIALLVYGIIALTRGKFSAGKEKIIYGGRARILGALCLTPLPIAFTVGFCWAMAAELGQADMPDQLALAGVEFLIVIFIAIMIAVLANSFYKSQEAQNGAASLDESPATPSEQFEIHDPSNPFATPRTGSK